MYGFRLLLALFIVVVPLYAYAQLENSVWVFPKTNLIRFDKSGVIETQGIDGPNDYNWTPSCLCDSSGKLICYLKQIQGLNISRPDTPVVGIFDAKDNLVDTMKSHWGNETIFISQNDSMVHLVRFGNEGSSLELYKDRIRFLALKQSSNNEIILNSKNNLIYDSSRDIASFSPNFVVNRHANGIDWWLVVRYYRSTRYLVFLNRNNSYELLHEFEFSGSPTIDWAGTRRLFFNHQGTVLGLMTYEGDIHLYDFNRCSGEMKKKQEIDISRSPVAYYNPGFYCTAQISQNDKYLYVLHNKYLFRGELEDLTVPLDTIATVIDSLEDPYDISFYDMRFAIDGRLYITCGVTDRGKGLFSERAGVSDYLAVVHEPDSADCRFEFRGLKLPNHTTAMLPRQAPFEMPPLTFADLPVVPKDALRRCPGGPPVELHPAGMRYENVSYRWEPAAGLDDPNAHNPNAAPETTTTYTLYLEGLQESCWPGDTLSRTVTVEVAPPPKLLTEPQTAVCPGESVLLQAAADTGWACRWEPATALADPLACQTLARPETSTTYTLTAENEHCGGFYEAEVAVEFKTCGLPPLPTVFSPNGDGVNDAWPAFQNADFVSYSLKIYDRWGRELFSTQNPLDGWDGSANGTPAPEGVYFYRLDAATTEGAEIRKTGSLTVVR